MLDFYDSLLANYNPLGVLFTFFIWVIMLWLSAPMVTFQTPISNRGSKNTFFLLFALVSILGLHRWDTYHVENTFFGIYDHLEPIHEWIRVNLSGERELTYRFIIWGSCVAMYYWLAKKLNCCNRNFCLACTLFLVDSLFPEMRGTSGHTLLLLGVVLLIKSEWKKFDIILGIILVVSAFFFHRSIFICHLFAIIALFPFDKKNLILASWFLFPVLVSLIDKYFSSILLLLQIYDRGNLDIANSVDNYGNSDFSFGAFNLVGLITRSFIQAPLFLTFFYLSYKICLKKIEKDWLYRYLFRWYYICFYVGCLFSYIETSAWLSVRIKAMALFPLPFLITRIWDQEKRATIWTKAIIIIAILSNTLALLMRYNNWSLGKY